MSKIRNDLILIIGIIIIALVCLICFNACSNDENLIAEVYFENNVILTIDFEKLEDETIYYVDGAKGKVGIKASKKGVWIFDANCPDQLCIKQGIISNSAQTITCLPNKIIIKLVGKGVDIIV